jgi:hypothetical protein
VEAPTPILLNAQLGDSSRNNPVVEEFESLSEKLARVTAECERLRAENERLRRALTDSSLVPEEKQGLHMPAGETVLSGAGALVHEKLSVPEKIALFRSLFRGREDVYALRWEAADGKPSCSPACIRDWKALRSLPEAERRKLDKATRQLLPVTDEVINAHLSGKCTAGIYPLLPDDTCWFLAIDFDRESWKLDAVSFVESCRERNVPAALERSRSGDGGARLGILQRPDSGKSGTQTRCGSADKNNGKTPSGGSAIL